MHQVLFERAALLVCHTYTVRTYVCVAMISYVLLSCCLWYRKKFDNNQAKEGTEKGSGLFDF